MRLIGIFKSGSEMMSSISKNFIVSKLAWGDRPIRSLITKRLEVRRSGPYVRLGFLILAALVPLASLSVQPDSKEVIAYLSEDVVVTRAELQAVLRDLPRVKRTQLLEQPAEMESFLWRHLLKSKLVVEANRVNWAERPKVKAEIQSGVRELTQDLLAASFLKARAEVAESFPSKIELEAAYAKIVPPPSMPTTYVLAQILLNWPTSGGDDAERAKEELRGKARQLMTQARNPSVDFGDLAKANSQDATSAANGGVLTPQPIPRAQMHPAAAKAAAGLKVGEVSDLMETAEGVHIFKLLDKLPERPIPLAEIAPRLRESMRAQRVRENERVYLNSIARRSDMQIDEAALAAAIERLR
jgi:peptidylprolyl isomerase